MEDRTSRASCVDCESRLVMPLSPRKPFKLSSDDVAECWLMFQEVRGTQDWGESIVSQWYREWAQSAAVASIVSKAPGSQPLEYQKADWLRGEK